MSFFVKSKQVNGFNKLNNRKKRRIEKISKSDEEISSSSDEETPVSKSQLVSDHSESEDENETAQEKKLRLAKVYLEEIEREERRRLEGKEIDKEVISQRLKEEHLKQIGKYEYKIASQYIRVDNDHIKLLKCRDQRNTVTCICITSDDKFIFSGSKDGIVIKWSLDELKKIGIIPFAKVQINNRIIGHGSCINAIAVSTDNKFLTVGDMSGMIQVWNAITLEHINTLKGHKGPVTALVFKQNSHALYSCSQDRSVRVWSVAEMAFVETLFGHQDSITAIDVLNAERPITAGGRDCTLRLWKIAEESQLVFNTHPSNVDTVKLINEQYFLSGGNDGQISIWSCLKKKAICTIKEAHGCDPANSQPYWISAVAALPYADVIASGSEDGFIRLWKLENKNRTVVKLFEIPLNGFVNSLVFTSNGNYLIAGIGRDHRLGRWSTIKQANNGVIIIPLVKNS